MAARKAATAAKSAPKVRGHVVSVFGPFGSRTLVEMSTEDAQKLLDLKAIDACGRGVIDAVDGELDELRARSPELAASATAASARALAYELENPGNSATSKSMCARVIGDHMQTLRELAPPAQKKDGIDELKERLHGRRHPRRPAPSPLPHP
jgi:hypothetical protein